ncbi:MAG: glycoside hydrolase family 25 protein [Clostridia bacterium]|nr:glycoside hydrolase family 25 protein [Clostridia bacterium]
MYKIKVFFSTLWRFVKTNPAVAISSASVLGVVAATAVTVITVNYLKSKDVSANAQSITSSINFESVVPEELPSEPEVPPAEPQPVEKQVTYKGKQINVVKAEVAKKDSKEDAENGSYKTEDPPAPVKEYKKPQNAYFGGIDVSSHNGAIDWAKVRASGVEFAMIRCGYRGYLTGKIVTDATFNYNIENAYKNGIDVGIYFYSTATNEQEALEEAAYVVERIKEVANKGVRLTYPVAYDFEEFYNTDTRSRAKGLEAAQISANTTAFLDYIKAQGYTPMLYAGKNPIKKYWVSGMAAKYNFWLAHYTEATEYDGKFFMWQYTSGGSVDGISGRVDLDVCGFETGDNLPQFLICKNDGVSAYSKPEDGSEVLLTLEKSTIYLCRNTFTGRYKEIKISDKYYYVLASELIKIPFEKSEDEYKTADEAVLYSKPFDDTYKTDITLKADVSVTVTGIWNDKWAEIEYDKKIYYIKADKLSIVSGTDESETSSDYSEDESSEVSSSETSSDTSAE